MADMANLLLQLVSMGLVNNVHDTCFLINDTDRDVAVAGG